MCECVCVCVFVPPIHSKTVWNKDFELKTVFKKNGKYATKKAISNGGNHIEDYHI